MLYSCTHGNSGRQRAKLFLTLPGPKPPFHFNNRTPTRSHRKHQRS